MIAVGVGNNIRHDELKRIAMGKDENVFQVSDFVKLPEKLQDIINSSCQDKCKLTNVHNGFLVNGFNTFIKQVTWF